MECEYKVSSDIWTIGKSAKAQDQMAEILKDGQKQMVLAKEQKAKVLRQMVIELY